MGGGGRSHRKSLTHALKIEPVHALIENWKTIVEEFTTKAGAIKMHGAGCKKSWNLNCEMRI